MREGETEPRSSLINRGKDLRSKPSRLDRSGGSVNEFANHRRPA
jgi:hypothetical protein